MTDPTPTCAEVERPIDEQYDTMMDVESNPTGAWMAIQSLAAENQAMRERAETAEAAIKRQAGAAATLRTLTLSEVQHLKDMDRSEYNAAKTVDGEREANAMLTDEVDRLNSALTAAHRAEAAAWNDAIEAAAVEVESLWAFRTCREVTDAIRALRRATPTEGEA